MLYLNSRGETKKMNNMEGMFTANELASYINYKYLQLPNKLKMN